MKTINPYTINYTNPQIKTGNRIIKPNILKPIVGKQVVTRVYSKDFIHLINDYKFKLDIYNDWYFDTNYVNNISLTNDLTNLNTDGSIKTLDDYQTPQKYGIVFYTTYINDKIIYNCSGVRIKSMDDLTEITQFDDIYISDTETMKLECYVYKQFLYDDFNKCLQEFNNLITLNKYIQIDEYNYCYSSDVEYLYDPGLKDIYNELYENITFLPSENYTWEKLTNCYKLNFDTQTVDEITDVEIRINNTITYNQFTINKSTVVVIFPINTINATDNISMLVKFVKKVG